MRAHERIKKKSFLCTGVLLKDHSFRNIYDVKVVIYGICFCACTQITRVQVKWKLRFISPFPIRGRF